MMARTTTAITVGQNAGPAAPEVVSDGLPQTLWRHKWVLVGSLLLSLCVGAIFVVRSVPVWPSSSQLLFQQNSHPGFLGTGDNGSTISDKFLNAQIELIRSTPILDDAAAILREKHLKALNSSSDITATLANGLDVSVGKEDGIVTVAYACPYKQDSAVIVNTVVDSYRKYETQNRKNTARDTLSLLQREKDSRDAEVTAGMRELQEFKKQNPAFSFEDGKGNNIVNQKLSKLSDDLTNAQSNTVNLQARYDSISATVAAQVAADSHDPQLAADTDVSDADPNWIQAQINQASANLLTLQASGLPAKSPRMMEAEAYLSSLRHKLVRCEMNANVTAMNQTKAELDFAQRREADLQKLFDSQKKSAIELNTKLAESTRLEDVVNRAQRASDELDSQIKTINVTEDIPLDVRILEEARPATTPQGTKSRTLGMAAVLGLLVGVGLSLGLDVLDQRLRSPEEVRGVLGLPVLGVIPHQAGKPSTAACGLIAHSDPMSEVAEAARSVRTAVFFASRSTPAKTVLVASPTHGDGKSTFVSNLAIAMAQAGSRTLLVDANFREPEIAKIFDIQTSAGLSEVLAGKITLDRAISRTPVEGLEVLPSGPIPRNPSEMLNSPLFAKLIEQISDRYQCILLDSPPVLSVTDARILGATADITLFVVRTGSTSRKAADQGLDHLLSVGSRVLGAVVNDAPRRKSQPRARAALRFLETLQEEESHASARSSRQSAGANGKSLGANSSIAALGMEKNEPNVGPQVDVID